MIKHFRYWLSDIHLVSFSPKRLRLDVTRGIPNKREYAFNMYGEPKLNEVTWIRMNASFFNTSSSTSEEIGENRNDDFINVGFANDNLYIEEDIPVNSEWEIGSSYALRFHGRNSTRNLANFYSISGANPRSMIGQHKDGQIYFITVDGRSLKSRGLSSLGQRMLCRSLRLNTAVNLDGGGSSVLIIGDEVQNNSYDGRYIGNMLVAYRKFSKTELKTLVKGNRGVWVHLAQRHLKNKGYDCVADGIFGSITKKLVQEFQRKVGLNDNGAVDTDTWNALLSEDKQETGLVSWARSKIGSGYVFGTQGEFVTQSVIDGLIEIFGEQHYHLKDGTKAEKWIGKFAFDCSGLIVAWLRETGKIKQNEDLNTWSLYNLCEYVSMKSLEPGDLVFNYEVSHVGIYTGDNKVIHARGTKYGVVETELFDTFAKGGRLVI